MSKKTLLTLIKTVLPLLLGVYLFWYFFHNMSDESIDTFIKAMKRADYIWIVISLILGFISMASRAARWKYVLEPIGYETKFWHRYHAILIGYLINFTIPRAGEASRSAMLFRSDGVPFMKSFGTIISERAVDTLMLGSITLITIFIGYPDFIKIKAQMEASFSSNGVQASGFQWKYVIYAVILTGIGFVIYKILRNAKFKAKIVTFLKDAITGVLSIFKLKNPLGYIAHTLLIWLCYIGMFVFPFYALPETSNVGWACIFMGFVAGSIGVVFTNGGIGSYPLLVGLVIAFYIKGDYPDDAQGIGNALGLLIWISQTFMIVILGLISLVLLPKNYSKENEPLKVPAGENS